MHTQMSRASGIARTNSPSHSHASRSLAPRSLASRSFVSFLFLSLALTLLAPSLALPVPSAWAQSPPASADPPLLLRQPAISATQVVFLYANDLWIVPRGGGEAKRLTSAVGEETNPAFSPDGRTIAFTGAYDGNYDVYTIPAEGGVPTRLTFHPSMETVTGWTPDGRSVLFNSPAAGYHRAVWQLYEVPAEGGFPECLPLPIVFQASMSPNGTQVAYVPNGQYQEAWKRYRGGQTTPIWIANLRDSSIERVPRDNSNDSNPMWIGDTVYFLSDRNGPVTLFAYDTKSKQVREAIPNRGLDFKSAAACDDAIVYEQFGSLHLYDLASGRTSPLRVRVSADLIDIRPHYVDIQPQNVQHFALSPTGVRAVMEAWGEIFTLPADKGDIRNLTRSCASAQRDPSWSPDGRWIACFCDASGEYQLTLHEQNGMGEARVIDLGSPPSYYYTPVWSPDSRMIAYADKRLNLWVVDVSPGGKAKPVLIDTNYYDPAYFDHTWSPDGKWIAYVKQLPSRLHAVFAYSLEQKKSFQITDGMSDAAFPRFDKNGKYLYFAASTDVGLSASWLDMSSDAHPLTRSVYVAVLSSEDPSPLAPESDEEEAQEAAGKREGKEGAGKSAGKGGGKESGAGDAGGEPETPVVRIDIEGIGQRILALPIPAGNYVQMLAGKSGVLFLAEAPVVSIPSDEEGPGSGFDVQKFDLEKRECKPFTSGILDLVISENGEKLLFRTMEGWTMSGVEAAPAGEPAPGEGPLSLAGMQAWVDPRPMWSQMYHEAWRIQRDFFYDPNCHGLDIEKVERKYQPYLEGLASRAELNYLLIESLGEITVGHMYIFGGDQAQPKMVQGGLLGADYAVENGRYRITRVYNGENWNPQLQAPLTQPGVNGKAGEYVLAVNGRELTSDDNIYEFFENTAGRQVLIELGPNADGAGSREVTVVPIPDESNLRHYAWMEDNRRKVDEMTNGRVAYVYLPNTAGEGYSNFNRYFFAQVGKEAAIIDERFNGGGQVPDYIIDYLDRPLMSKVVSREGADWLSPGQAIYGPKVMLINEMAGSGGDALPWYFRKAGIGPLVGKRTWGGLVGIGGYPLLIDGGFVTSPRWAFHGLDGEWEVENHGIAPDYEVDLDPEAVRLGRDPQLEKAVTLVMEMLEKSPKKEYPRPAYPNYHRNDGLGRQ